MEPRNAETRERTRSEWLDPDVADSWRRLRPHFAAYTRPLTELLLDASEVASGDQVLDLASGAGEPALALAAAVGARGHVIATDLSHAMLAIVGECVRSRGLTNLSCRQADAGALTFPNESFDLVTSRLGIMQSFPADEALREAWRVLKVGGRIALLVWDPAAWHAMRTIVATGTSLAAPKPDRGFEFIAQGALSAALSEAGFRRVSESSCGSTLSWPEGEHPPVRASVHVAIGAR